MSKKQTKKIDNSIDYQKSSFKWIIEDIKDTENGGLKSVPKIRREQVQVLRKPQRRYHTVMAIVSERVKNYNIDYKKLIEY
jgi:hypothetical protein